ncbi:MAG: hypothetical protein ACE5H9_14720 [Anaerolineae bacterium]
MPRLLSALRIWTLVVIGLHLLSYRLDEANAWSVWPFTFLPLWLGWGLGLLAGSLVLAGPNEALRAWLAAIWQKLPGKKHRRRWFALASMLAALLFWAGRIRHLRWGDANILVIGLSFPEGPVIYNWQSPLTIFLHQRLWALLAGPLLGWGVGDVYAASSILCGAAFVYLLLNLATWLERDALRQAVLVGFVGSTGAVQLFFGYVENYTVISLGLLVFTFAGLKVLRGELALVWAALALSITNGFHPSTVFLWPSVLYLAWVRRRAGASRPALAWQVVLPPLLVGGGVLALMESGNHGLAYLFGDDRPGGGDGIWFVPLFETTTQWQHYTMFSAAHLLDWLNEHFLISPFGLPVLAFALIAARLSGQAIFSDDAERRSAYFLAVAGLCYLLLTWLWNPDYGGRKDWDLFAPSAFVYTILAAFVLNRALAGRRALAEAGVLIAVASLLHSGPWIYSNTRPLPGPE